MNTSHLPIYISLFAILLVLFFLPVLPFVLIKVNTDNQRSTEVLGVSEYKEGDFNVIKGPLNTTEFKLILSPKEQRILDLKNETSGKNIYLKDFEGIYAKIVDGKLHVLNTSNNVRYVEGVIH